MDQKEIICPKCGSSDYHIQDAAQWGMAICNQCEYYITWVPMTEQVICTRCGLINDYRTVVSGPHLKAICNGCDRYIKFLPRAAQQQSKQYPAVTRTSNIMSQGYYGSFCLDDLFQGKLVKGTNGKTYVCIDDLTETPFQKGKTNGKTYVGIGIWVNDSNDEFGNIAGISLQQTKQDREQKVKKIYIGNLKMVNAPVKSAASPVAQPAAAAAPQFTPPPNNLPF